MSGTFAAIASLGAALLGGGTFEKVLLAILVVAVLVVLVLVVWLVCKLAWLLVRGLGGKAAGAAARVRERRSRRRAERADAPAPVRAGWMEDRRPSLRRALREARSIGGDTAPWAVVVSGEGSARIERELGLSPAPAAEVRVSASERIVLVDAANATERTLRRLARRLPWRRPFDALVVLAPDGVVAPRAAHRAALVARGSGFTAALHLVLPGAGGGEGDGERGDREAAGAAHIVATGRGGARDLLAALEADVARAWLGAMGDAGVARGAIGEGGEGGRRDAVRGVARTLGSEFEEAVRALRDRVPAGLDLAGLAAGAGRIPETISATADRTRPDRRGPLSMQGAAALLVLGIGLAAAGALDAVRDAERLANLVQAVEGQRIEGLARAGLVPDPARTGLVAGLAVDLAEAGGSTWTRPAGHWLPGARALRTLAAALLVGYVGRPLGAEIERRTVALLTPAKDLETWTGQAARADRLLGGWNALLAGAAEADAAGLLDTAFGAPPGGWPAGVGAALERTGAARTLEQLGVVDRERLRNAARAGLLGSARAVARRRYLDGPVLAGARVAADPTASPAERHAALERTRNALGRPAAAWLVEIEDRPEHAVILPVLARALGLSLVESDWVARAGADLSRARRQAREEALRIAGPQLGTVLERGGGGAGLRLSSAARAWLEVLDRIEAARLDPGPQVGRIGRIGRIGLRDRAGPMTLDTERVRRHRARIERYEDLGARVPPSLPPALAAATLEGARERLAAGLSRDIGGVLVALPAAGAAGAPPPPPDRDLVHAIETTRQVAAWLDDNGLPEAGGVAHRAADRAIESHLGRGLDALLAADPIRIEVGRRGADPERVRERLARSAEAVRALHRSYAEPLLGLAEDPRGEAARRWRSLARALDAWERGDVRSGIGGLASLLDAFAADPAGACADPRFPPAPPGYLGQVVRRTRSDFEAACRRLEHDKRLAARDRVLAGFDPELARSWPWSGDPASPDAPPAAVDRYVRVLDSSPDLSGLDARYVPELERERALWTTDAGGGAGIELGLEWRARPAEDENAHHLISIEVEGTERRDGLHRWRYGTPVTLRLRLARNSPYRFAASAAGVSLEHVERFEGSASFLRMLDTLARRGWRVEAPLVDEAGRKATLRLSVGALRPGGGPFDLPAFAALGRGFAERRA